MSKRKKTLDSLNPSLLSGKTLRTFVTFVRYCHWSLLHSVTDYWKMVWCIYFTLRAKDENKNKKKTNKKLEKILCIALDTSVTASTRKKKLCSRASLGCRVDLKFSFFLNMYCTLMPSSPCIDQRKKMEKKWQSSLCCKHIRPRISKTPLRIEGLLYLFIFVFSDLPEFSEVFLHCDGIMKPTYTVQI